MNKAEHRILYMGTPDFAVPCLQTIIEGEYNLVGVITQPDKKRGRGQQVKFSPVKEVALKHGLPVYQPTSTKSDDFFLLLQELSPDLIIVVAFGQILSRRVLEYPALGCINVHASLLPKYRGAAPIHRAVMNGESETGVTLMHISEEMDAGDIILSKKISIPDDANVGQIHDQLALLGAEVLREGLPSLLCGQAPRVPQNHREATYAAKLTEQDEKINWAWKAMRIYNQIRGLDPWPGAYTILDGKRVKIWRSKLLPQGDDKRGAPGEIVEILQEGIAVQTGEGRLLLQEIQPEGKRRMDVSQFLLGNPVTVGSRLGLGEDFAG